MGDINKKPQPDLAKESEKEYLIKYICPNCNHKWNEVWSCACDSECPKCDTRNIQATSYELIEAEEDIIKDGISENALKREDLINNE